MTTLQAKTPVVAPISRQGHARHRSDSAQLTARLAIDRKTKQDCYKLRYLSYIAEGHIEARHNGTFSDEYDDQPTVQSVVIYKGSRAVASTRICVLTRESNGSDSGSIPAQHVFPEEIEALFRRDVASPVERVVEINRLVRHPDLADDKSLVFLLFRLAGYFILKSDAGAVVSCVRRNHISFYTRLRFSEVAGPCVYHGVKFSTHLLSCLRPQYDTVRRMVPLLDVAGAARAQYDRLCQGETVVVIP